MKRKNRLSCLFVTLLGALAAAPAAAQAVQRVVVIPFNPINVTRVQAEMVYGAFEAALAATGAYSVVGRDDLTAALESRQLDLFGCTSDLCAAELGDSLSAAQAIRGELLTREGGYTLKVKVLEVASGQTLYVDTLWTRTLEQMRQSMELFAHKVAGLVVTEGKEVKVARELGQVFVETAPSRAEIFVNGVKKGISPDHMTRVPLGPVRISARQGGLYGEKTVTITRTLQQVRIELTETSGSLLVAARENLDVYLDGIPLGPLGGGNFAGIPVGIHSLELKGQGLYWREDVTIRAGERTMVLAMPVPYGTIQHEVPTGAAAEIRGQLIREVLTGYGVLPVPAGEYTVAVAGRDYERSDLSLSVASESTTVLRPQLRYSRAYQYALFTGRIEEAGRSIDYGYRLTAGDVTRLRALKQDIAQSGHGFDDLLARVDSLIQRAETIVATEAPPLPEAGSEAAAPTQAQQDRQLSELLLRRQQLQVQIESKRLERGRKNARGWASFGAGVACGGLTVLFRYLADEAYQAYQTAGPEDFRSLEAQVRLWDICTIAALGAGGVCLLVSTALWASSPSIRPLRQEMEALDREIELQAEPAR